MTAFFDAIGYDTWILHALIWLPLVGMIAVLASPEEKAKKIAFGWTAGLFVLSLGLWCGFNPDGELFQLSVRIPWIDVWGVSYALGMDGISLAMVLLTTLTMPLAILGSFNYIKERERAFYALMLLLQTGIVGVFVAMDLFLFYIFFELTLVPMYFIIGVWGGERRVYAAVKFFLYTALGSLLMLVGILYLYLQGWKATGVPSFHYLDLLGTGLSLREEIWLLAAFTLAFSIKVPLFPLHTWLPDAHVEAPTPGSVVLAAVLLKMGTYGLLRFVLPFFPNAATHAAVVAVMIALGVAGIIYAAWVAAVQPDAKKLVAYTSVAHMGFVVIGIFALTVNGIQGGLMVMISHGISTGALFLLLGMLYERRHTRVISEFGGLARVAPLLATAFIVTALASIGLPGTSGFVGEFLALLGTFERHRGLAIVAATGVIFAAYYMLPMVQRILFNRLDNPENLKVRDLSQREIGVLAPLVVLMIVLGIFPTPVLTRMAPGVAAIVEFVETGEGRLAAAAGAESEILVAEGAAVPIAPASVVMSGAPVTVPPDPPAEVAAEVVAGSPAPAARDEGAPAEAALNVAELLEPVAVVGGAAR